MVPDLEDEYIIVDFSDSPCQLCIWFNHDGDHCGHPDTEVVDEIDGDTWHDSDDCPLGELDDRNKKEWAYFPDNEEL